MKRILRIIILIVLSLYTMRFVRYEGNTTIMETLRSLFSLNLNQVIALYLSFVFIVFSLVMNRSYEESKSVERLLLCIGVFTVLLATII